LSPKQRTALAARRHWRSGARVLNTSRQLGGALAVAVFGALVAHREAFLQGLQVSLVIAAVLLLVTAVASLSLWPARHGAPA
jgi:DHA2 family methylenomycin A resistance protein-like MFS transporter